MKKNHFLTFSMLIFLVFSALTIFPGCHVFGEQGDGKVTKQVRNVTSFNAIEVSGAVDLFLSQGTAQSVIVETDENLQDIVRTEIVDNTLRIDNKKPIAHATVLKVYVTVTELKELDISGAVDCETSGKLSLPDLSINSSGASDIKMDLSCQKLGIDCSGGSKLKLSGTASEVNMDISGAVDLFAYELVTDTFRLSISGAGKAEINVRKVFDADISGAATVRYKGNPEKIHQNVSGAGSIKQAD